MATIDEMVLDTPGVQRWDTFAERLAGWVAASRVELRRTVVLLPFAQLLAPARAAFARRGGFLPTIETTQTLAATLGPPPPSEDGAPSFDAALDRLVAARELARQPFGRDWRRRDRAGFEAGVAQFVQSTHALARAAGALPPHARAAYWQRARSVLGPRSGPGAAEQQLARGALEWAALMAEPATDRLFHLQPAAWVVVRAGGVDALAEALLAAGAATRPALLVDADRALAPSALPAFAMCDDIEQEAQASAAQVLSHLREGTAPVALIALDRSVVRRVHALLARQNVGVRDETGWRLSTTRAAATVMAALLATAPTATTDALFDWLKSAGPWPGLRGAETALRMFEATARSTGWRRVAAIAPDALTGSAAALWQAASNALTAFDAAARRPLADGLAALGELLAACGVLERLRADDAGRQVLAALRLDDPASAPRTRLGDGGNAPLDGDELRRWIDALLEERSFKPRAEERETPQVVIVPMARAMLRPFAAVICPGADAARLGAWPAPHPLLADRQLAELGLPDAAAQRQAEALGFAQLTALPNVTLLRRRHDDGQPLGDSPLVERLQLEFGELPAWQDPRGERRVAPAPVLPVAPQAGALLPDALSASAVEALRACPYRFFALHLLRLREPDELDAEVEKRDYGTWLHAVLLRFHTERQADVFPEFELDTLHALALAVQAEQRLPDEEFLPYIASFTHFAPRYLGWLRKRDAAGTRWLAGEHEASATPAALDGLTLRGRIDRIDLARDEQGELHELIDYKTGSFDKLRTQVNDPFEDTQLAFYAALLAGEAPRLSAKYLVLDDHALGPRSLPHADVARSAAALVAGLAGELARIRAGAPLRPLGEPPTCDYCEARGLCRRDHWTVPEHPT